MHLVPGFLESWITTLVTFVYYVVNVKSDDKGDINKNETMTLLSLFPFASSNNLQCALQLSRNQAGHRLLLLFHQTIEIEFLHHNLYASSPLPCLSCIFLLLLLRSACSIGKSGEKG